MMLWKVSLLWLWLWLESCSVFFFFFKSGNNVLQIFHDLEIESKSYVCYQFYQETYVLIWESALHISNLKIGIFTNQF